MRIEQLKYFLETARCGSINKASEHLFVSQQGLSDALKRMEREINLELFHRSKTGVTLTKAGECLLEAAGKVVTAYEAMENQIFLLRMERPQQMPQGSINLLANPLSTNLILPELLEICHQANPHFTINCRDASGNEIVEALLANEADVGLTLFLQCDVGDFIAKLPAHLKAYRLFDDEIVACISRQSPLAHKKFLTADEFDKLPTVHHNTNYISSHMPMQLANYQTSNSDFHLKLILNQKAVGTTISYFFAKTFPQDLVMALSIKPAIKISYYIIFDKQKIGENLVFLLDILAQYVESLTSQRPEYRDLFQPKN